jgi:hypothetical protein
VTADGNILGELDARSSQVLQALREEVDIAMQLALKLSNTRMSDRSKATSLERRKSLSLSVILYGPDWLADDIASLFRIATYMYRNPMVATATLCTAILIAFQLLKGRCA